MLTAALAVLAVLVMLVVNASAASAHDSFEFSAPRSGATVAVVPAEVVLTFDEPAREPGTSVVVTGPGGQVQRGSSRLVGTTVHQPLADGAPAGRYAVAWRVTSADGHAVSGSFSFTATTARPGRFTPTWTGSATARGHATSTVGLRQVGAFVVLVALALAYGRSRRRRRLP
jgi:methionine-rich copper-binding protein CopC